MPFPLTHLPDLPRNAKAFQKSYGLSRTVRFAHELLKQFKNRELRFLQQSRLAL